PPEAASRSAAASMRSGPIPPNRRWAPPAPTAAPRRAARPRRSTPRPTSSPKAPELVADEADRRRRHDRYRLRKHLRPLQPRHQQLQDPQVEREGGDADEEEARGLEAGVAVARVER